MENKNIIINDKNIDLLSSDELSNLIVVKQQELESVNKAYSIIKGEILDLRKQIHDLEGKKMNFQVKLNQAKQVCDTVKIEIEIITRKFFDTKNAR